MAYVFEKAVFSSVGLKWKMTWSSIECGYPHLIVRVWLSNKASVANIPTSRVRATVGHAFIGRKRRRKEQEKNLNLNRLEDRAHICIPGNQLFVAFHHADCKGGGGILSPSNRTTCFAYLIWIEEKKKTEHTCRMWHGCRGATRHVWQTFRLAFFQIFILFFFFFKFPLLNFTVWIARRKWLDHSRT